jgi:hypothetical protein
VIVFKPFYMPRSKLARKIRRAYRPAPHAMICRSGHKGLAGTDCRRGRTIIWHNCAGCGGGPLGAPWISSCEGCHPARKRAKRGVLWE